MRTRRNNLLPAGMVALACVVGSLAACTLEQILIGQWYTFYTPPSGACPRLQWRFVVDPQRAINGSLSVDGQRRIADLHGVLGAGDTFQITATDVVGHRTADVTGQFTSLVSTLSIHGDAAGSACDGQSFAMRLGGYFAFQGGGGGGGG